ncbi:nicotinate-nucleotide--dimethylbenzimidazole phosphoribosyltransferase [Pseudomonas sp. RIT-PI-S]|uniref:nicotinate-nucleotide--dimethylbenzimidazole phosphoribosyltransferase n=1 Tax=Pseudomonas sp. RIT-PI-S TaxID=3035295 RepID=UPI0021D9B8BE|nr:nicotinate-nucleotide--dimethylbenzimidazole phosphoribosyltransferase [Pseudomonas sp. RIT-PI-S]
MTTAWWQQPCAQAHAQFAEVALERQRQLTKPAGSLGQLEAIAVRLAALQGTPRPRVGEVHIGLFAGDHGVVAEGVSPYPQEVTGQMLRNFINGGAAISVLARSLGAHMAVVDMGTLVPLDLPGVRQVRLGAGTRNFAREPAMTTAECEQALLAGRETAQSAANAGAQLFIGGEMGIGNTTAASALGCLLLDCPASELVGPGTGLDADGVSHKARVIEAARQRHAGTEREPLSVLACFGGFEIAALVGSYLGAAQAGLPVLVDGFICSVAALVAVRLNPGCQPWLFFAHQGAEPGHKRVLQALDAEPLLALGLRLGEGSGAALAVPLMRLACELHGGMATFAEAAVADRPA